MPRKPAPPRPPTRERILVSAVRHFQQVGYHGASLVDILTDADAPKGSMYHHFPEGKEQIALLSVERARLDVLSLVTRLRGKGATSAEIVRLLAKGMGNWLRASGFAQGSLLTSVAVGAVPDLPRLHAAIHDAFDAWRAQLAAILVEEGCSSNRAADLSTLAVATLEGAMLLARIDRHERPLLVAAEGLAEAFTLPRSKPG
jgi:TetR/AcrR family transcriptional repressor of lmrAB and yxaGH operons